MGHTCSGHCRRLRSAHGGSSSLVAPCFFLHCSYMGSFTGHSPARGETLPRPSTQSPLGQLFLSSPACSPQLPASCRLCPVPNSSVLKKESHSSYRKAANSTVFPFMYCMISCQKAVWQVVIMMQTVHTSILKGSLYGHFFLFSLTTHLLAICWKLLTIKCDTDFSVATDFIYSQAPLS